MQYRYNQIFPEGFDLINQDEDDYKTIKVSRDELELQSYLLRQKGWQLKTFFKIGDDSTLLCTFKKVS